MCAAAAVGLGWLSFAGMGMTDVFFSIVADISGLVRRPEAHVGRCHLCGLHGLVRHCDRLCAAVHDICGKCVVTAECQPGQAGGRIQGNKGWFLNVGLKSNWVIANLKDISSRSSLVEYPSILGDKLFHPREKNACKLESIILIQFFRIALI